MSDLFVFPDPEIRWVVERHGILLVDSRDNRFLFLGYPEAALWDMIARNRMQNAPRLLSFLLGEDAVETARQIDQLRRQWLSERWLSCKP